MHIVLYNPEIPQNSGNIARTCAATGCMLHLIKPLGFSLSDKYLKRAGLDYWDRMTYRTYDGFDDLLNVWPDAKFYFLTTKASKVYTDVRYHADDFLVFGCETRGLPENLLERVYDRCIRIPMVQGARSLNLSNSVAVVAYEALRQLKFPAFETQGSLTGRDDGSKPWMDSI